jgi:hypothetical protein
MPEPADSGIEGLLRRLPVVRAPAEIWPAIRAGLSREAGPVTVPLHRRRVHPWLAAAVLLLAVGSGVAAGMLRHYAAPRAWQVLAVAGRPEIGGTAIVPSRGLPAGEWLATDSVSRAVLQVGRIGVAEIGPGSRVRVDRGGVTEHRLTLLRGRLDAVITAPPRLFFVRTPTALATDLGCAYSLEVAEDGATRLEVTAGWVELSRNGQRVLVPAGLVAEVRADGRPGIPYPVELPPAAREALRRLAAGSRSEADLALVLSAQYQPRHFVTLRLRSAVTLWHLLQRVEGAQRLAVYETLAALAPPPVGVTREGILALERPMLERWRRDLSPMWAEEPGPWWVRLGRRLWVLAMS